MTQSFDGADPSVSRLLHIGIRAVADNRIEFDESKFREVYENSPALVEQLASHGIHIMVEKPLGVELKSSVRAVEAAKSATVYLGVNFQRRYWPAAQRLREAIEKGRLGKVVQGECTVCRKPFSGTKRRRYCSPVCNMRAYRRRKKEGVSCASHASLVVSP